MANELAIEIHGLGKKYGRLPALMDLKLDVRYGEIFGFLGLNGAGKTTTIRILLDLLRPTTGRAKVFGKDCQLHGLEVRQRAGYLPGEIKFYGDMTGEELLNLLARVGRRPVNTDHRLDLQKKLELSSQDLRRKIREYSAGMKRKLGIIQAFQTEPELLILDEPTEGLDPLMQESFYEVLFEARRRGRTVFMSSHVLSEVEKICDRIAVLRKGELVLLSPVNEVRSMASRRVRILFDRDVNGGADRLPAGHEILELKPRAWTVRVPGDLGPLIDALAGLPVRDLEVEKPRLEDVLLKYYRGTPS